MYTYQAINEHQIVIAVSKGKSNIAAGGFIYGLPTMLEKYKEYLVVVNREDVPQDFVVDWWFLKNKDYDLIRVDDEAIYKEIVSEKDFLDSFPNEM
jgi:hypothetical protein